MALIDDLAASVKALADDSEAEVNFHFNGNHLAYPSEKVRYDMDMKLVYAARALLAKYELQKEAEQAAIEKIFGSSRTTFHDPVDYTPFVKPAARNSPQFDALLCELGAIGVRLDVLRGK